jgi:hypothetical protein
MALSGIKQLVDSAYESGNNQYSTFRKTPAISSAQGNWVDLSMAPGNPRPNFYTGLERKATLLNGDNGIFHGSDVTGEKYLHKLTVGSVSTGAVPCTLMLCDFLLYYPVIDMDNTDEQLLDNTTASLPRYTDGRGVEAMLVATNPYIGGSIINLNYTSATGRTGLITQPITSNSSTLIGTVINSGTGSLHGGAFFPRCQACTGVKSVESLQFQIPNGGLAVLVLVKPLLTITIKEITAQTEIDFAIMKNNLQRIYNGAYLNFIVCPNGGLAGVPIFGELTTIWK